MRASQPRSRCIPLAALALAAALAALGAAAQSDTGQRDYEERCTACHGPLGKGDGKHPSMTPDKRERANLTELARRNDGVFPILLVTEIIDGRGLATAHGMDGQPAWGEVFRRQAREGGYTPEYIEGEVRRRIWALAEYIYRLQK